MYLDAGITINNVVRTRTRASGEPELLRLEIKTGRCAEEDMTAGQVGAK